MTQAAPPLLRRLAALAPLALIVACTLSSGRRDAQAYVAAMSPVLAENTALAEGLLALAADIKKRDVDEAALLQRWDTQIADRARDMHARAAAVQPQDPALAQAHTALVRAWDERAQAFEGVGTAAEQGEPTPFEAALEQRTRSRAAEREGLEAVNQALAPHGLSLDPYPDRAAASAGG